MDVKQMIRLIIKAIGFIYWFVFLYLGGLMVVDWSGFMSQHNIETPLFLTYLVFVGCFVTPYIMLYWKKLNPNVKVPFLVRHLSEFMVRLEDCHSIWFEAICTKIIALFRNNSVDALYHITYLSSYCVDSSSNFTEQLMMYIYIYIVFSTNASCKS